MAKKAEPTGADINNTVGGSPVTTTIDENKLAEESKEIQLGEGVKLVVGEEKTPSLVAPEPIEDTSFFARANQAGIGKVMCSGGFDYVGVSPQREKAEHENGSVINGSNSVFTPLSDIPFDPSQRCKIGDEYFFPQGASRWEDVELNGKPLVPAKK